jgi:hypothetical protein
MGVVLSLLLIAGGAILAFAVHSTSSGIDVNTVGVILLIVGAILFVLSLVLWRTWWGVGFWGGYYDEGPVVQRRYYRPARVRRRTVVEDEAPPPDAPPY